MPPPMSDQTQADPCHQRTARFDASKMADRLDLIPPSRSDHKHKTEYTFKPIKQKEDTQTIFPIPTASFETVSPVSGDEKKQGRKRRRRKKKGNKGRRRRRERRPTKDTASLTIMDMNEKEYSFPNTPSGMETFLRMMYRVTQSPVKELDNLFNNIDTDTTQSIQSQTPSTIGNARQSKRRPRRASFSL